MPVTGGIKFLTYTQTTPAAVWTITHNFGKKPIIEFQVYDNGNLSKIFPGNLEYVDDNTVEVTWSIARSGFAILASEQVIV